ncbi:hypothetical protein PRIPAC_95332 [Pristionchus pacificus]|nr:hypothetical protein PRIPAC_95332 [Pristionchus pacificus]
MIFMQIILLGEYRKHVERMSNLLDRFDVKEIYLRVSSHHAVFNWTSCFYEPPVTPAVDPSTVDVPAVLYAARDALNNPGLATGKVAHDVTLELLNGEPSSPPSPFSFELFYYCHSVAGGDEEMRECRCCDGC